MARHKRSHQRHGITQPPALVGQACGRRGARQSRAQGAASAWATREAAGFMQFPKEVPVTFADVADLGRLVPHDAPHQGVVDRGRAARGRLARRRARRRAASGPLLLVLDQVTDPHNVGAILRSAAAFGAIGIVTQDRHSPPESGALAKAASGALERVPWARVVNLARALEEIGEAGFWRIGLAGEAEMDLKDALGPPRVALVLGAEGPGPAAQHARALRRAGAAADQRRGRKPQRLQRRRGRALRGEHRLMVRTAATASAKASRRWPRASRPSPRCSSSTAGPSRAAASPARTPCCGRSSASRSASPRRARCGPSSKPRSARRPTSSAFSTASDEELRAAGISRQKAGYVAQPRRAGPVGRARPRQPARGRRGSDRAADQDQGHRPLVGGNLSAVRGRAARRLAGRRPRGADRDRAAARPRRAADAKSSCANLAEAWRPHRGAAAVLAWHSYNAVGTAL